MKTAFIKNILREIKNTKARFISIMLIVAIGVGFFVGVKSASPSMEQMAIGYYEDTNLMDMRLVSTVGFDDDDVAAIKKTGGIEDVMPSYYLDASVNSGEAGSIIRLLAVPAAYEDNEKISTFDVIEGRMPQKAGEIAIEDGKFGHYEIGDTINIDPVVGDIDVTQQLNTLQYKVVGVVKSSMYISLERGTTNVGTGKIDEFAYISEDSFSAERYTVVYATLNIDQSVSPFSDEYEDYVEKITAKLERVSDKRVKVFTAKNIDKAQKVVDDGRKELEDQKADTKKKLSDAQKKIEEGEKELDLQLSSAQAQIDSARAQLDTGKAELKTQWDAYYATEEDTISKLNAAKNQLEDAQAKYDDGCAQVQSLNKNVVMLENSVVRTAQGTINGIISSLPENTEPAVVDTLTAYSASVTADNASEVLLQVKTYLSSIFGNTYNSTIFKANAIVIQLQDNISQLEDSIALTQVQLASAKEQLDIGWADYNVKEDEALSGLETYKNELSKSEDELNSGYKELESSIAELDVARATGLKEIEDSKKELEKSKTQADEEFAKAEKKLNDAQSQLDEIGEVKWYIFDRSDNPAYSGFIENTNRVDAVATVFPLFFLLVAMLVCLTTMTRLVEEKRTEIGTLKAIGYSNKRIIFKFVSYSCMAALLGCLIGSFAFIPTLPRVIYNAYGMLYNMRDIDIVVDTSSLYLAVIAAFACCSLVTFFVCYRSLKNKPASLMRPKAPKAGKRILIERISFIWKRFNFSSKVTWRNLFRYKSRLLMTVVGIAGCTALMLTAFGLYDSINDVIDLQFNQVSSYNTIVVMNDKNTSDDTDALIKDIRQDSRFENTALVMQKVISVSSQSETVDTEVYLTVTENATDFERMIHLRERESQKDLTLNADGVILSEKLAKILAVDVGDMVTVGDDEFEAEVVGICENYVYNYVYISADNYAEFTGDSPEYNMAYAYTPELSDTLEKQLGTDYLDRDDVTAISFTSTLVNDFEDMISSMNIIVLVMIICAGALAIVVLYNLTNINLAERNREIATIKVLGFKHLETANFVYRENIILMIFGIAVGLVLGIWLWSFVVKTVEIDTIMFGKQIHAMSYVWAALLTAVFSFVVNFIMFFRIKAVNMVESLKSIE